MTQKRQVFNNKHKLKFLKFENFVSNCDGFNIVSGNSSKVICISRD